MFLYSFTDTTWVVYQKKKGNLTQTYDKYPDNYRKLKKAKWQNKKAKTSITQRLRTDLGRSVGGMTSTKLVRLKWFTGSQPSH